MITHWENFVFIRELKWLYCALTVLPQEWPGRVQGSNKQCWDSLYLSRHRLEAPSCAAGAQGCRGCWTSRTCVPLLRAHSSCLLWTMTSGLTLESQPRPLSAPKPGHPVLCITELQKPAQVMSHFRGPVSAILPTSSSPNIHGHKAVSNPHWTYTKAGKAKEAFFSLWISGETERRLRGIACGRIQCPAARIDRAVMEEMEPYSRVSVWQDETLQLKAETRESGWI